MGMSLAQLHAMSVEPDRTLVHALGPETRIELDHQGNYFVAKVPPLAAEHMKQVFGARYLRQDDTWIMPSTRAQWAQLQTIFGDALVITAAMTAWQARAQVQEERDSRCDFRLFPFQKDGVRLLVNAGSALLADDMGLGKTVQAIMWMRNFEYANANGHLVICPNTLKYNWEAELKNWWPEMPVMVVDGTAGQRRKQIAEFRTWPDGVLIINYESLRTHTMLAPWGGKALTEKQKEPKELNGVDMSWHTVVVDEAHKIKDPKAQQTMAVKQMGAQTFCRLAMTGTPVVNNPDDLWSIMNFVAPDEWGSRTQFRNRYCNMTPAWHGHGLENQGLRPEGIEELDTFLQPRFLRRTKAKVLPQLPEKFKVQYRMIPLTTGQEKVYKSLVKDMMAISNEELLVAENTLTLMLRLRQTACAVPEVTENGDVIALDTPSNKVDAVFELLEEAPGEPLVVYADSRKFIELLDRELRKKDYTTGLVTGAVGAEDRRIAVDRFQDGQIQVFLGTLGAGAEGITLTRANRIVLAQQGWSHATNAQAIDRVHRIGQERGVQPIVLVSKGTVEVAVAQTDVTKEGRLQQLVRDPEWLKAAVRGEVR